MAMWLRYNTASQQIALGPFLDSTDGNTQKTALTIANTDIKLWKNGGLAEVAKNSGGATHMNNGRYYTVLDATDTNTFGKLEVIVHVTGALAVRREFMVIPQVVYDALVVGSDNLDVSTVQLAGQTVTAGAGVTFPSSVASPTNITAGTITTVTTTTNLTNLPSIPAGWLTAAGITAGALNGKGDWNIGKTGYSLSQAFPTNFSSMSISVAGLVDITQTAADKAWGTTARTLTAGTNIALAKGTGITGFNDLDTAGVAGAVWNAATASYGTANTYGALIETNLDAQVSTVGGGSLTVADIADGVWDEALSGHLTGGTTGAALNGAGSSGDPWTATMGGYGAGTAGKIFYDNLNATVSSRATQTSVDTLAGYVDTEVAAIKTKTDFLPSATAGTAGGLLIAGTNAATTVNITGNITGNLSGSVGSVTGAVGSVTGSVASVTAGVTLAATTHTGAVIPTVTTLSNLPAITAGWLTATGIAAGALNGKGDWNVGKTGYSLTQTFPANFSAMSISAGGLVDILQTAADKAWSSTTRLLTGGTNIVLAKGTGITGLNDLDAAATATAVWNAATVTYGSAGSYGALIETNLDAQVSTVGGGSGTADWTANQVAAISAILGVPSSGTTPADPTTGILDTIRDATLAVKAKTDLLPADPADASDIAASFGTVNGTLTTILADTNDIQTRLPAALVGGRMDANLGAINNSTTALTAFHRAVKGNVIGTVGAGSTTTSIVSSSLTPVGSVADKFKGRLIIFADDTTTVNLRGQMTDITANTSSAAPTFTVTALTTAPVSGDVFVVV